MSNILASLPIARGTNPVLELGGLPVAPILDVTCDVGSCMGGPRPFAPISRVSPPSFMGLGSRTIPRWVRAVSVRVTAELAEAFGAACPRLSIAFTIAATLDVGGFFITALSVAGEGTTCLCTVAATSIVSFTGQLRARLGRFTFTAWTSMSLSRWVLRAEVAQCFAPSSKPRPRDETSADNLLMGN